MMLLEKHRFVKQDTTIPEARMAPNRVGGQDRSLLSICMTARNDDYCGNFRYRLNTALNHLAKNAKQLNLLHKMDVLITDWNSDQPLGDALNLSSEAVQLCRFIRVPPNMAKPYNPPQREFNTALSVNVALRRAGGHYLMFMPCDILFPAAGFKNLMDLLEGHAAVSLDVDKTLMLVNRKFIPWEFIGKEPDIETIEKYLAYNSWRLVAPPGIPGLNAHMGAIIMRRTHWHAIQGLDESLTKWGWSDIELGLRVNQRVPSLCLDHFGVHCYEMDSQPQARSENLDTKNPEIISTAPQANSDQWGLGGLSLEQYRGRNASFQHVPWDRPPESRTAVLKKFARVPVISKLIQYLGPNITKGRDWSVIYMLAFYMSHYKPQYFVDYSIFKGAASYVVPLLDPSIYYIAIHDCTAPNSGRMLTTMLEYFRDKLFYKGHFHLVSGNIHDAFQRMVSSVRIAPQYDLIYFIPELFRHSLKLQLENMMQSLSIHGALICHTSDDGCFHETVAWIQRADPNLHAIKSYQYRTAIFIHTPPQTLEAVAATPASEEAYVNDILESWKKA